jgi:hypothetical protein
MRILFIALALLTAHALAQPVKSLEQLAKEEQLNKTIATLSDLDAKIDRMTKKRDGDCTRAVGYPPLCECLSKNLPFIWSFSEYVAITTETKETNGYTKMDMQMREAYDKVAMVRDTCVRQINVKR